MTSEVEVAPVDFLRESVAAGEHWYLALLKTMARWPQAEEVIDGRSYRYLIGGEAFDWLVLAERLLDELDDQVGIEERDNLLFHGHPPLEIDEDEFQSLLGTPKYQAYLNYLYGVVVEEALHLAIEEELLKEGHAHVWSAGTREGETVFQRLYGRGQAELLAEFHKERKLEPSDRMELAEYKEFTYWLFKYRVRTQEGARIASDTRKGLVTLSKLETALRRRLLPEQEPVEVH
jgi:hypothetical protein